MKKAIAFLLVVLSVLFLLVSCAPSAKSNNSKNSVKMNSPIIFGELRDGEYSEGKILIGYENKQAALEVAKLLNGTIVVDLPEIKMISVKFNGTVLSAYEKIKKANIKGIKYVEPSYKRELVKPLPVENNIALEKFEPKTLSARGEEEFSTSLWGLEAIGATDVWNEASGTNVIVAVVDTGVDGTHPDLQGQLVKGYRPLTGEELGEASDSSYGGPHGTHVAGTIAAKKDGKGIVGVAPNAKIMPIVIFDTEGYVGDDYVAEGIIWAVDHGAKVMNNSWGGWGYSHTMKAAFDYALEHGVTMVVSAGNDHTDQHLHYPSGYPGVIQVAAVEYYGGSYRTVWFSNRSDAITVGAPGVKILSTVPLEESLGYEGHSVVSENEGTYAYYQGTSMASPHVTGVVALLLQKYPNAKPWQIRRLLQQTAVDIDEPGFDHNSGYGLVNVKNAFAGSLPTTGGLTFNVEVTDAYGNWNVPTVFVTLKRIDGAGGDYFAKTDINGVAKFSNIDAGKYQLILGGPDSNERALANFGEGSMPGGFAINWRMEEERQITEEVNLTSDSTKTYAFESDFKVKFDTELTGASIKVFNFLAEEVFELPYNNVTKNLSDLSGFVQLSISLVSPATEDVTVSGKVYLNGHEIPVEAVIPAGESEAIVSDIYGPNAWWTVFGKK